MSSIPHHYCCPPPCCCTPTYTCDSCASKGCDPCDTSAPPAEVSKGSWVVVADRNGSTKRLRRKPQSLLSTDASGEIMLRDGSLEDPVILKYLQTLLDGKGVIVRNGQGVMGVATPTADDQFFANVGGTMQFVSTIPRSNTFNPEDFQPQSGKIATVGCEINGQVSLGYLDLGDTEYIYTDDGIPRGGKFCDAPDVASGSSVFVCDENKGFSKIPAGEVGSMLSVDTDKKIKFMGTGGSRTYLEPVHFVGQQNGGYTPTGDITGLIDRTGSTSGMTSGTFDMTTVPGYVKGARYALLKVVTVVNAITTGNEAAAQLTVNGNVVWESWIDSLYDFGYKNDASSIPCKLTDDKFTFSFRTYVSHPAQNQAFVKMSISGWEA